MKIPQAIHMPICGLAVSHNDNAPERRRLCRAQSHFCIQWHIYFHSCTHDSQRVQIVTKLMERHSSTCLSSECQTTTEALQRAHDRHCAKNLRQNQMPSNA